MVQLFGITWRVCEGVADFAPAWSLDDAGFDLGPVLRIPVSQFRRVGAGPHGLEAVEVSGACYRAAVAATGPCLFDRPAAGGGSIWKRRGRFVPGGDF
jgi:hypothetical protein